LSKKEPLKVLIMGLRSAGKTSLVKNIFEGREWEEIKNLKPTEFVETVEYRYRGLLKVTVFDAGGQKQFIYSYFTELWSNKIFGNVGVFIWVIDSSEPELFEEAKAELKKAMNYLREFSPGARKFLIASKYDKHKKTLDEIRKEFKDMELEEISATSIPLGIAREIICTIIDYSLMDRYKERVKKLEKILMRFNKNENAIMSMIVNKEDGLEIASSISIKKINPKLKYISMKTLYAPMEKAQSIFESMEHEKCDFIVSHLGNYFIVVYNLEERVVLISVLEERNFKIASMLKRLGGMKDQIIKILEE